MADGDIPDEGDLGPSIALDVDENRRSSLRPSRKLSLRQMAKVSQESEKTKHNMSVVESCSRCGKALVTDFCLCIYKIPFQCEKCFAYLENLSDFQAHMKTHAKVLPLDSPPLSMDRHISVNSGAKDTFKCLSCQESFNTKLGLMVHSLSHGIKIDTYTCKCPHCNREFTSTTRLGIHVTRMHVENKKFICNVCNKTFSSCNTLDAHQRLHLGIKPYKCDQCGKSYSQSGNLAYHKSTHSGVKSYICHLCGKAFLTSGILANHERRHAGLKPYVCDSCGRAFADNYTLTHHKLVHSGVRSFMCDICGKAFIHKHTLSSHKRIHSGDKRYRCPICDRAFTQMSTMLQHRNTHTGEKSYRCMCGKSFTQQSSLARHKRLHEGDNVSFSCSLCEKKFAYKSTLYKHKRRAHGINNTQLFST